MADDDFDAVGAAFGARTGLVRTGWVGAANAMFMPMRELIDFAAAWFPSHRTTAVFAHDTTAQDQ